MTIGQMIVSCEPDRGEVENWPDDVDACNAIQSITYFGRWTYEAYASVDDTKTYILRFDDTLEQDVLCVARYSSSCIRSADTFLQFVRGHFMGFVYHEGITDVVLPKWEQNAETTD